MGIITVELPAEMQQYTEDIQQFLALMVHKLHKNVHKGRWESLSVNDAFELMRGEMRELRHAVFEHNRDEIYLECADVANFAMIIASITRERPDG